MNTIELQEKARQIRIDIIKMIAKAGSGHPGGSLSATDILVALYYSKLNLRGGFEDPDRDRVIFSKGHAAPAHYAVLADKGAFPKEDLDTLRQFGSHLQGHPDSAKCRGIDCSTGSLGQGTSVGVGMALALKTKKSPAKVYVFTGDGELQEGIMWEAFMSAAHFKVDNLTVIIDRNRLQIDGNVADVMNVENLKMKMEGFGFAVDVIDGHNFDEILPALDKFYEGKPHAIIANTIKGKGVSFMENKAGWHGTAPKPEEAEAAIKELEGK